MIDTNENELVDVAEYMGFLSQVCRDKATRKALQATLEEPAQREQRARKALKGMSLPELQSVADAVCTGAKAKQGCSSEPAHTKKGLQAAIFTRPNWLEAYRALKALKGMSVPELESVADAVCPRAAQLLESRNALTQGRPHYSPQLQGKFGPAAGMDKEEGCTPEPAMLQAAIFTRPNWLEAYGQYNQLRHKPLEELENVAKTVCHSQSQESEYSATEYMRGSPSNSKMTVADLRGELDGCASCRLPTPLTLTVIAVASAVCCARVGAGRRRRLGLSIEGKRAELYKRLKDAIKRKYLLQMLCRGRSIEVCHQYDELRRSVDATLGLNKCAGGLRQSQWGEEELPQTDGLLRFVPVGLRERASREELRLARTNSGRVEKKGTLVMA